MGQHRVAERCRRHFRDHYRLHGSYHFTCLSSQNGAAEDPLGASFDYGFKKSIHLVCGPCPGYCQRSDRDLENLELQAAGGCFLFRQADMRQFRIRKKRGRYIPIISGPGTIPKNIISKNSKIVEGRVSELRATAHVTDRPDA
jgi:hypothetical protein